MQGIKILVKDIRDPYVIAYSLGENGAFYDIKQKTAFASFLQYFLGFVTVL